MVISNPEVLFERFEELGDASGMFGRKDTAIASIDDEIDRLLSIGSKTSGEQNVAKRLCLRRFLMLGRVFSS